MEKLDVKKIVSNSKIRQNHLLLYLEEKTSSSKSYNSKNLNEFIKLYSQYPFYFDDNFVCSPEIFSDIIKHKDNKLFNEIWNEFISMVINELFKPFYDNLLNEKKLMSIFKCEFCQDINNIQPNDIFYEEINDEFLFFHRNCFIKDYKTDKFNFKNIIEGKIVERVKNDLYKSNKELILNSTNSIPKNIIEEFFLNCEEKFYKITNDSRKKKDKSNIISSFFSSISTFIVNKVSYFNFDSKVFEEEIESFKILVNENEELKEEIINNEFMVYKNSSKSVKKNSILEKWKINIKEKINSDFNNKREKIIKWVVLSSYENKIIKFIEQEKKSQYDLIYLYEIIQIKNSNDLSILIKDDKFNENNDNNKYEI